MMHTKNAASNDPRQQPALHLTSLLVHALAAPIDRASYTQARHKSQVQGSTMIPAFVPRTPVRCVAKGGMSAAQASSSSTICSVARAAGSSGRPSAPPTPPAPPPSWYVAARSRARGLKALSSSSTEVHRALHAGEEEALQMKEGKQEGSRSKEGRKKAGKAGEACLAGWATAGCNSGE